VSLTIHCRELHTVTSLKRPCIKGAIRNVGLAQKSVKNTDVDSKRFETQDTILVELRVLSNNNLSRLADRLNV